MSNRRPLPPLWRKNSRATQANDSAPQSPSRVLRRSSRRLVKTRRYLQCRGVDGYLDSAVVRLFCLPARLRLGRFRRCRPHLAEALHLRRTGLEEILLDEPVAHRIKDSSRFVEVLEIAQPDCIQRFASVRHKAVGVATEQDRAFGLVWLFSQSVKVAESEEDNITVLMECLQRHEIGRASCRERG